jgi:2-dehydropantoate 2-reductase
MKILVFGAGVIGTLYAWAFESAGHSVSLLVRPGHEDRWTDGINLQILDARGAKEQEVGALYRPHIVSSFAAEDGYDVVIEAVRYSQTDDVLPGLVANLGEAILLLFSNNWQGLDAVDRLIPKGRYVLGLPVAGGAVADHVLDGALQGRVVLGSSTCGGSTPSDAEAAQRSLHVVADLFRSAGFEPDVQENMQHSYWVHFASTAVYTAAAVKAGGFPAFAHSSRAIREALAAGREAMEICRARGVDVAKVEEARPFMSSPLVTAPFVRRVLSREVTTRTAQTRPDYAPEFQRIYHDVVETGRQLKVPAPHLDAFSRYVDAVG